MHQLTQLFPHYSFDAIRALVSFAAGDGPRPAPSNPHGELFLNNICETKRILHGGALPRIHWTSISSQLDFLNDRDGVATWTCEQALNFLLIRQIKPSRKTVAVTAMRDDGIYILEWVAHHRAIGIEHIIVYTNDNSDGSDELLRVLASHGAITLVENEISGKAPPESKAFGHAIQLFHDFRDFEWALFIDSDEYLVLGSEYRNQIGNVLDELHRRFPAELPAAICYDWLWFVSGMVYQRRSGSLMRRFQYARPHHLTKTFARTSEVMSMRRDHYPEVLPGGMVVDSIFEPIDLTTIFSRSPQYAGGRINHYWPKSFEEFLIKKARGATLHLEVNMYDRPYSKFFTWNGYETPDAYYPPDPDLLERSDRELSRLQELEGVKSAAAKLDANFNRKVKAIGDEAVLRRLFLQSKTVPGPL